jgi:hypothetical protein
LAMDDETYARWYAARLVHGGYVGGKEAAEHYIWRSMIARCNNPRQSTYKYYGARGVRVDPRWYEYSAFLSDVGPRPSPAHSIDRIDPNGGYEPGNVRWATRSEQQKNKTTTKWYTDGEMVGTLVECAAYLGISKELAHWRWSAWGTFERGVQWRRVQR